MAIPITISDLWAEYETVTNKLAALEQARSDGLATHLTVAFTPADAGKPVDVKLAQLATAREQDILDGLASQLHRELEKAAAISRAALIDQLRLELGVPSEGAA